MIAIVGAILSRMSPAAIAVVAGLVFYEGLPLVRDIPLIRHVPIVGPSIDRIAIGRIGMERRDAAADERAAWEEATRLLTNEARRRAEADAAKIAEIERAYLLERADRAIRVGQLEEIIDDLERDAEAGDRQRVSSVSRRLSVALDRIGKAGRDPVDGSANPGPTSGALRPGR